MEKEQIKKYFQENTSTKEELTDLLKELGVLNEIGDVAEIVNDKKLLSRTDIEAFIEDWIRKHGTESAYVNDYVVSVRNLNIIVDGRCAEEYEDLDSEAPCLVTDIIVNKNRSGLAMKICTYFSTGFPLMSDDTYNTYPISTEQLNQVAIYLNTKSASFRKVSTARLKKVARAKWLDLDSDITLLQSDGQTYEADILHLLDCAYCCYDQDSAGDVEDFKTLEYLEEQIFKSIGVKEALCIKMTYSKKKELFDSSYLAEQRDDRWERWNYIVPKVYKHVDSLVSKELLDKATIEGPDILNAL